MKRKDFIEKYTKKTYLGDGLYATFDGVYLILSTERENGQHWIGLEPSVFDNLIIFREAIYKDMENIDGL